MNAQARLKIGSRGSPLALKQAQFVKDGLIAAGALAADDITIEPIRTSGDKFRDRRLADIGGKGLFSKEIEEALIRGEIDIAVHSLKDMETELHPDLAIAAVPPREDPRDALICEAASDLAGLPAGAVVGTASLRRQAQVLSQHPHLSVRLLRGNVGTRLEKVRSGEVQATLLALCGLQRLNMSDVAAAILDPAIFIPAVGQGALALECRADDDESRALANLLNDETALCCARAERAFLAALDGSCRTPIGGYARIQDDRLVFHGALYAPDGSQYFETRRQGSAPDAVAIGRDAGMELRRRAGDDFFAMIEAGS